MPHQGIAGPVHGHMIGAGEDHAHVPGLEGGQDPGQVPGGDPGLVLALAAAIPGLDQGLVVAHALDPDQGPDLSLGQDLDRSRQLMIKNQGRDHLVKKNQDQSLPWKLRLKKKGSVQNLVQGHVQSLVLSQGLVLVNAQLQEVDLDLRALSKTVNLCILYVHAS